MMTRLLQAIQHAKSRLALKLIVVLSVAILPLGMISVYQTSKVLDEARALSEIALLDMTRQAASEERELIQSAIGAAEAISSAAHMFKNQPELCDQILNQLIDDDARYNFAGFINLEGQMICSSSGDRQDLSDSAYFKTLLSQSDEQIDVEPVAGLNGQITLNISVGVRDQFDVSGFVWISIPFKLANDLLQDGSESADLLVFSEKGDILAAESFSEYRRNILPRDKTLVELTGQVEQTFRTINRKGELRDFAVVPIIDDTVYVLGSWDPRNQLNLMGRGDSVALYFPFMMWVAAMVVAYFGVNRLVIRHVHRLMYWMRLYAGGQTDFSSARLIDASEELEAVAVAFRSMTARLAEQDRQLKSDLEEKTTLLREVHHRVKNNLQLISSIMNIQIRNATGDEAKLVLRRVQDRVMALSAIHRYLYLSRKLSMVRADKLLGDIIQQLVVVGSADEPENQVKISTDFDQIEILPDQSVPLTLLTTEAAMNAVKYCSAASRERPWINLVLSDLGEDRIALSVVNSRDPVAVAENEQELMSTGLGSRLIESFVSQLDGTLEINTLPDRFEVHVAFTLMREVQDDEDEA